MARQLLIVRHAKSAWDAPHLADHDRPLAPRGKKALKRIRDHLTARDSRPDLVLCSTARRAVDTLAGFRDTLPASTSVEYEDELYLASAESIVDRLHRLDDDLWSAMVVGHNPGLHQLAFELASTGDPDELAQLSAKFPTGAVATISFDGEWFDLGRGPAHLDNLFTPRKPR